MNRINQLARGFRVENNQTGSDNLSWNSSYTCETISVI